MSTQQWSFAINHSSDAGFRAWGADFTAKLAAIGLTKTADTGQIDWVTVARPAINTTAGYEIWRFNDVNQALSPIYMRFDFGTDNAAGRPRITIQIGLGSNGSGALTDLRVASIEMSSGAGTPAGAAQTSFFVYVDGFMGLIWGHEGAATNVHTGTFIICRSADANGDPDDRGCWFTLCNGTTIYSASSREQSGSNGAIDIQNNVSHFNPSQTGTTQPKAGLIPGQVGTSSLDDGDIMVYPAFGGFKHMFPLFGYCFALYDDIGKFGTFDAALIGVPETAKHTFINMGASGSQAPLCDYVENFIDEIGHCMLWE
jgi:hypothetical protein